MRYFTKKKPILKAMGKAVGVSLKSSTTFYYLARKFMGEHI